MRDWTADDLRALVAALDAKIAWVPLSEELHPHEAFERRIMIVGPSTLLATLRTVASIWRYEYQNQNAQEIARQGGALYDKLAGLVDTLEKLGRQLGQVQESHGNAMKQLSSGSGNLLGRAERLRKLGARTSKQLAAHLLTAQDEENEDAAE